VIPDRPAVGEDRWAFYQQLVCAADAAALRGDVVAGVSFEIAAERVADELVAELGRSLP